MSGLALLPDEWAQHLRLDSQSLSTLIQAIRPLIREFSLSVDEISTTAGPVRITVCSGGSCGIKVFVRETQFDVESQPPIPGLSELWKVRFTVDIQTTVGGQRAPWTIRTSIGDLLVDLDTTRGRPGFTVVLFLGQLQNSQTRTPPNFWRIRQERGSFTERITSTLLPGLVVGPVRVEQPLEPADFVVQKAPGSFFGGPLAWTIRNNLEDLVKTASNTINGAVSSALCEQVGARPCPVARYPSPALGGFFRDAVIILGGLAVGGWLLWRGTTAASRRIQARMA